MSPVPNDVGAVLAADVPRTLALAGSPLHVGGIRQHLGTSGAQIGGDSTPWRIELDGRPTRPSMAQDATARAEVLQFLAQSEARWADEVRVIVDLPAGSEPSAEMNLLRHHPESRERIAEAFDAWAATGQGVDLALALIAVTDGQAKVQVHVVLQTRRVGQGA